MKPLYTEVFTNKFQRKPILNIMISPQEKAKELVDKFYNVDIISADMMSSCNIDSKQCALIAQKNLLNKLKELNIVDEFEEEVLFEINAL